MKIKDIELEKLSDFCGDLLSRTYLELGQNPNPKDVASLGVILVNDLKIDFPELTTSDISHAFRLGVRGDLFHVNVKTYYKWIKTHQDLIWINESKQEYEKDKRLIYRSRKGTGMNLITNSIKQIK